MWRCMDNGDDKETTLIVIIIVIYEMNFHLYGVNFTTFFRIIYQLNF